MPQAKVKAVAGGTPSDNPFGKDYEEVKAGEFIKWEEPGQLVKGILVEVDERPNSLKGGELQKIYTLELEDGTEVRVSSRGKAFDSAMKRIVIGQHVAMLYVEDIKSKTAGNHPFKLIKVGAGQVDAEWLEKNKGEIQVDDLPFDK